MGAFDFIASHTVTGGSENVITFSSIPQTYKDLYLVGSILVNPGNTGGSLEIFPDNGSGGFASAPYGATTRFYIPPSGALSTSNFTANWKSDSVGGLVSSETGPCYFEWTLQNYATSGTFIAGFNQVGWSSMTSTSQEQYLGAHSVFESYSGSAPGPITSLKLAFTATYLAVGTKISLYGIGS